MWPTAGFVLFTLLYIIAAALYPGGSEADRATPGFSWLHNYWCDLLETHAENGQINPARPIAISGMIVLCSSIALFFYNVPGLLDFPKWLTQTIRGGGLLSMVTLIFLQADYHDTVINISFALGVLAMLLVLAGLFRLHLLYLFSLGIFSLLLAAVNTYIYYSQNLIDILPLLQKVTFLSFLLWFSLVSVRISRYSST